MDGWGGSMSPTPESPPVLPYLSPGAHRGNGEDLVGSVFVFCLSCYITIAAWSAVRATGFRYWQDQPIFLIFGCCSIGIVIIMPAAVSMGVSIYLFRTLSRRWRYAKRNQAFALTAVAHSAVVIAAWTAFSGSGSLLFAGWPQLIANLLPLVLIPALAPLWLLRSTPTAG